LPCNALACPQVTPLHTDPHPNLLCQAAGRKYVRLYPPSATPAMYPHAEGMHTNSGQVDVDEPDLQQFPLYGREPFQGGCGGSARLKGGGGRWTFGVWTSAAFHVN